MYFLIDFENVGSEGLKGAEYLLKEDTVIIFFSRACEQIHQGCLHQIMESFCRLDICKLKKTGKNGLDFYIATKAGEIFGSGYLGKAAIVSRDQGFMAVRDYWRCRGKVFREVMLVLHPTRNCTFSTVYFAICCVVVSQRCHRIVSLLRLAD